MSDVRELHDGVPDVFLFDGDGIDGAGGSEGDADAGMGVVLHAPVFVHDIGAVAEQHSGAVPALAAAQALHVVRSVRDIGVRGVRAVHHVVPGGD